jgi:hypothetical protein
LAGVSSLCTLLAACGGGDPAEDLRRTPLAATAPAVPAYDREDLYRFFAIAFSAAPGVTYMGQLVEAADYGLSIKQIVNIFTTKPQFLETYPANLTHQEFARRLVDNVVGTSASAEAKAEAVNDIVAALSPPVNWTRGDITFQIFNNLARKPANDPTWSGTARKMANQVVYARHFTETMKIDTVDLVQLRAVVKSVTEASSVNLPELGSLIQSAIQTTVAQSPKRVPVARATAGPLAVQAGSTAQLDGRSSFAFDGRTVSYTWRLESRPTGSAAQLSSATAPQTAFTADTPGTYVVALSVSDGVSESRPAKQVITAVPATAALSGLTVVNSLNSATCTPLNGCPAGVLSDFLLTLHQCTVTKVGPRVTLARPGMEPVTADFDGDVVDRAGFSGGQLVIGLRGSRATDQISIGIDRTSGALLSATGSATLDGVTRSIDCSVVTSGIFPVMAAQSSITSVADLLRSIDPRDCRGVANGASFSSCGSSLLPDFSLSVGASCLLSKSGDTLTVSRTAAASVSAKLNAESPDAVGEAFDAAGNALGQITLMATDSDPTTGSQQSITLRINPATMEATLSATDLGKGFSRQLGC